MPKKLTRLFPALLLMIFMAPALSAQNIMSRVGPHAQDWVKDKFSVARHELATIPGQGAAKVSPQKAAVNETIISGAEGPESEIAYSGPTDPPIPKSTDPPIPAH